VLAITLHIVLKHIPISHQACIVIISCCDLSAQDHSLCSTMTWVNELAWNPLSILKIPIALDSVTATTNVSNAMTNASLMVTPRKCINRQFTTKQETSYPCHWRQWTWINIFITTYNINLYNSASATVQLSLIATYCDRNVSMQGRTCGNVLVDTWHLQAREDQASKESVSCDRRSHMSLPSKAL
jgi:hypothetical protein